MLYFFLSYARGDDDPYVERFYTDLCAEVRVATGEDAGTEVGFLDRRSIEPGRPWSGALVKALADCPVFLALCSPAYYRSVSCGREWSIFEDRLAEAGDEPPALLPLIWQPAADVPSAVRRRQHITAAAGGLPDQGLRQLLRLARNQDAYREFLSTFALRIAAAHRAPGTGRRGPLREWADVASAFHPVTPGNGAGPAAGGAAPAGSHHVYFVVAAPTATEVAAVRTDLRHYGERSHDWAPYRPALDMPLGSFAAGIAADSNLGATITTVDQLFRCIERAVRHNQIVVLLVDPWSTRIPHQEQILHRYDQRREPATAVLIPWSRDDAETNEHTVALEDGLRRTFMNALMHHDMSFRWNVFTHRTFQDDLQTMLEVARNRVFTRGIVHRLPASAGHPPRPILEGP